MTIENCSSQQVEQQEEQDHDSRFYVFMGYIDKTGKIKHIPLTLPSLSLAQKKEKRMRVEFRWGPDSQGNQPIPFFAINNMTPEIAAKGVLKLINLSPSLQPFLNKEQLQIITENVPGNFIMGLEEILRHPQGLKILKKKIGEEQFKKIDGFISYLEQMLLNFPSGLPEGTFTELSRQISFFDYKKRLKINNSARRRYSKLIEEMGPNPLIYYYA